MRDYKLADAFALHEQHGASFALPDPDRLAALEPGDFVKVCRHDERFWIEITKVREDVLHGTVANRLGMPGNEDLPVGAVITARWKNVYDTILAHLGETEGQMN
jgi:hypothetical protein